MLRRKSGGPDVTDPVDLELLEAVDEGVSWRGLLRSASCPPEEAEGRLMRLLAIGALEGTPGEAASPRPAPPLPQRTSSVPARPSTTTTTTTAPPSAHAAGESLLRELMRRTSGTGFAPVSAPPPARGSSVPPSPGRTSDPGQSAVSPRISTTPPTQSVPPNPYGSAHQSGVNASVDDPFAAVLPPDPGERRRSTTPPSSYGSVPPAQSGIPAARGSSTPPGVHSSMRPTADGLAALSVTSALLPLIEEFSHGQGMQRWAAARLREAVLEEAAGNLTQAVAILQVVMAQIEEPRVRAERDRLQAQISLAASGIHRSRALEAERQSRYREAAEYWSKVLDASPRDTEAALHASLCAMQAGDIKQAGVFAKRAVELAPNNINAHKLLHRFFRKTGMERSAKREEEIIQKLKKA